MRNLIIEIKFLECQTFIVNNSEQFPFLKHEQFAILQCYLTIKNSLIK